MPDQRHRCLDPDAEQFGSTSSWGQLQIAPKSSSDVSAVCILVGPTQIGWLPRKSLRRSPRLTSVLGHQEVMMPKGKLSPEGEVIAAYGAAMVAAFQVLIYCLEENDALLPRTVSCRARRLY